MWDGMNKLQGELILDETSLQFRLTDFSDSDLKINLTLSEIDRVSYEAVYGLDLRALKIQSVKGRSNLFVLDNAFAFKELLQEARKLNIEE
jgi:hypothetical protein